MLAPELPVELTTKSGIEPAVYAAAGPNEKPLVKIAGELAVKLVVELVVQLDAELFVELSVGPGEGVSYQSHAVPQSGPVSRPLSKR